MKRRWRWRWRSKSRSRSRSRSRERENKGKRQREMDANYTVKKCFLWTAVPRREKIQTYFFIKIIRASNIEWFIVLLSQEFAIVWSGVILDQLPWQELSLLKYSPVTKKDQQWLEEVRKKGQAGFFAYFCPAHCERWLVSLLSISPSLSFSLSFSFPSPPPPLSASSSFSLSLPLLSTLL